MAKRRYCKNTVPGKQGRGKKYPAAVRAEVVMAMIGSNSICAVARRYGVPESTIRSWMAEEAGKPDGVFAAARVEAAREIAAREKLHRRLDEDAKARQYDIGVQLKSEDETLQDTMETGLVAYGAPGSYDRQLSYEERKELEKQLERYDSRVMTDRDAANVAAVLITAAGAAAALVPQDTTDRDSGQSAPAVLMEPRGTEDEAEVILDGPG